MTPETIKKLAMLCNCWEALDKERTDIEAQIAQLTSPPAPQPASPAEDDEIRVGDLVEVVTRKSLKMMLEKEGWYAKLVTHIFV